VAPRHRVAACTRLSPVAPRPVPLAFGLALTLLACGPSFQVVYEGDARFEHCYALEEFPAVPMQDKTDCWTQWVKRYTYGQTRNRVDYAIMRAKALQEAHAMPTDEAFMSAAPGGGTSRTAGPDEPVTTNAFATPPKTQSEGDAGELTATPVAPLKDAPLAPALSVNPVATLMAPADACTTKCRAAWQGCRDKCKAGACVPCDKSYGGCMKRCF